MVEPVLIHFLRFNVSSYRFNKRERIYGNANGEGNG